MQAIILLAGYGSRLDLPELPHKVLLKIEKETLLSRHLHGLEDMGIAKVLLVVGHNAGAIREYVGGLNLKIEVEFIFNKVYRTTGNTLSLVMGLRQSDSDVLILDGDVLYPHRMLQEFINNAARSSFAIIPADIDNAECAKALLGAGGTIQSLVTKRLLTEEEKSRYKFAGEAIGFIKLSPEDAVRLVKIYDENESGYINTLWEEIFTELAPQSELFPYHIPQDGCFEIDTQEDYEDALTFYKSHPELFLLHPKPNV